MQSKFAFVHQLSDADGQPQETAEHYVTGVEADGLGRVLMRFGEFLFAVGFDVTVSYSNDTVIFDWRDDDAPAEADDDEEYADDTHGLDVDDATMPEECWTQAPAAPAPASQAHPDIFGNGQLVTVKDDPKGPDAGWVEGLSGFIVETKQDNALGTVHLVRFNGFRKPKHFIGDRDTWWVIAADLQPL